MLGRRQADRRSTQAAGALLLGAWRGPEQAGGPLERWVWPQLRARASLDNAGALPAVCCKQRSTLILTPPCLPVQSRDDRPLRSEPEYVAWTGHTLSETSSGVLPTVLSFT